MSFCTKLIGVVGCIFGVYEFYCYQNPNVIITYRVQESEDLYLSLLSYAIASSQHFGYAEKYDEEMQEWWLNTNEIEVRLRTDYVKPINVYSDVYIENGQAIITYNGTANLPNGENVIIDERVELDFIVSDNLP